MASLLRYLQRLNQEGFVFSDGVAEDFISTNQGAALIDCTSLQSREEVNERYHVSFEEMSGHYSRKIITDLSRMVSEKPTHQFSFSVNLWRATKATGFQVKL